jgi:hypothetical protein
MSFFTHQNLTSAWEVFLLFAIPIGGGIPAGVVLAQNRGFSWVIMTVLYLLSDIALALVFEPLMMLFVHHSKNSPAFLKMQHVFDAMKAKIIKQYGVKPSPLLLFTVAFGADPMSGRIATRVAGHNAFTGWTIAILGDMLFFAIVMVSTIWLHDLLGDGTATTLIIMAGMIFIPPLVRRVRGTSKPAI